MKTLVGYDGDDGEPPRFSGGGGIYERPKPLGRGQAVRVVDGPFVGFVGIVDSVNQGKDKIRVRLSVAGRETTVDLDLSQVERLS